MRSSNSGDKLALQQVKEGAAKGAWIKEQVKFEIERLNEVLRDRLATNEEKSIAQSQIANYWEMAAMTVRPLPGWLRQMDLLADPVKDRPSTMEEGSVVADEDLPKLAASGSLTRTAWS